ALNWLTLLHDLSRVGAKGFRAAEPEGCIIPPARLPIGPVPTEDKFFHELVPEPATPLAEISASGLIRLNGHFRERSICGRQPPLYTPHPFHDPRPVRLRPVSRQVSAERMAHKRQPMKPQLGNEIREPCYLRAEGVVAVAGNRASAVPQVVWSHEVAVQQVKSIKGLPETKTRLS